MKKRKKWTKMKKNPPKTKKKTKNKKQYKTKAEEIQRINQREIKQK